MLDLASLAWFQSPEGEQCLAAAAALAPSEEDLLPASQTLARAFPERLARLAVAQTLLRRRAAVKFPHASRMFFNREGLEQATPYPVAALRAARYEAVPRVFDLCSGLGGDALALAERSEVIALEGDPLRMALLRANARAVQPAHRIHAVTGDVVSLPLSLEPSAGVFFDPARRIGGRRLRQVQDYRPPLPLLKRWAPQVQGLAAKVSPAVDRASLTGLGDFELEFVSLDGELREACLWFGRFRTAEVRATLLPGPHTLAETPRIGGRLAAPGAYLYEPDPAVLRAGLVVNLAEQLGLAQLDPTTAYLTGDGLLNTPFARAFTVLEAMPFSRRRLQAWLTAHGVGEVTIKKRGSPVDPAALSRQLRLKGERSVFVFLTRLRGAHSILVATAVQAPDGGSPVSGGLG